MEGLNLEVINVLLVFDFIHLRQFAVVAQKVMRRSINEARAAQPRGYKSLDLKLQYI